MYKIPPGGGGEGVYGRPKVYEYPQDVFLRRSKKNIIFFYLDLCITKKTRLGLAKFGLKSGVVLFSSGYR